MGKKKKKKKYVFRFRYFDNMKLSWFTGEYSKHGHSKKCFKLPRHCKGKITQPYPKQKIHYFS